MRRALVAALAFAFALVAGGIAVAGYALNGPVVAHGESPAGVPWEIRGEGDSRAVTFEFSVDPPGYSDARYFTQLSRPIPRRFVFTAVSGSDISPFEEGDVSGIADKRVKTLVIKMNDDSKVSFHPRLAPKRVRKRHVWARGLRFFDQFFSSDLKPHVMKALNGRGRVLERIRSDRGSF